MALSVPCNLPKLQSLVLDSTRLSLVTTRLKLPRLSLLDSGVTGYLSGSSTIWQADYLLANNTSVRTIFSLAVDLPSSKESLLRPLKRSLLDTIESIAIDYSLSPGYLLGYLSCG